MFNASGWNPVGDFDDAGVRGGGVGDGGGSTWAGDDGLSNGWAIASMEGGGGGGVALPDTLTERNVMQGVAGLMGVSFARGRGGRGGGCGGGILYRGVLLKFSLTFRLAILTTGACFGQCCVVANTALLWSFSQDEVSEVQLAPVWVDPFLPRHLGYRGQRDTIIVLPFLSYSRSPLLSPVLQAFL